MLVLKCANDQPLQRLEDHRELLERIHADFRNNGKLAAIVANLSAKELATYQHSFELSWMCGRASSPLEGSLACIRSQTATNHCDVQYGGFLRVLVAILEKYSKPCKCTAISRFVLVR